MKCPVCNGKGSICNGMWICYVCGGRKVIDSEEAHEKLRVHNKTELKEAWEIFIKEQERKNAKQRKQRVMLASIKQVRNRESATNGN